MSVVTYIVTFDCLVFLLPCLLISQISYCDFCLFVILLLVKKKHANLVTFVSANSIGEVDVSFRNAFEDSSGDGISRPTHPRASEDTSGDCACNKVLIR